MIITVEVLDRFKPCKDARDEFARQFPEGVDISGLWGTEEEADAVWKMLLADDFLKKYVDWGISVGLLPARIRANLRGADLSGADLSRADLSGADLSRANLRWANLSWAKWNKDTIWPDGFEVPA